MILEALPAPQTAPERTDVDIEWISRVRVCCLVGLLSRAFLRIVVAHILRFSLPGPRLLQEGGKLQIRLAGPSWSELGWLGAQEFRLEGVPAAPSEVSQGTHHRQTAVRVTRA